MRREMSGGKLWKSGFPTIGLLVSMTGLGLHLRFRPSQIRLEAIALRADAIATRLEASRICSLEDSLYQGHNAKEE